MNSQLVVLAGLVTFLFTTFLPAQGGIVSHPDQLRFAPLEYEPPHVSQHRHVLSNGVVGFFVEDHELPLVNISLIIRAGSHLDPDQKRGLTRAVFPCSGAAGRSAGLPRTLTKRQTSWQPVFLPLQDSTLPTPT